MKKKSALLVSISMVLVAVLALTTASFAWFTASMNPTIDGFDVQVTTTNALLIGTRTANTADAVADINGIKFKTNLSVAELVAGTTNATGTAITNELLQNAVDATDKKVLSDITPKTITGSKIVLNTANKGLVDFLRLKNFEETPDFTVGTDEGYLENPYEAATNDKTAAVKNEIKKDYVQFDLYFKANFSTLKAVDVKLDLTSKSTESGTPYNGSDFYAVKKKGGTDADKDTMIPMLKADGSMYWITTAMRAGFVATRVLEADGSESVAQTGTTPSLKVLELDGRTPTGIVNNVKDNAKVYTADHTFKANNDNTTNDDTDYTDGTDMPLFTMNSGCVYKMTVFMWIEGNDAQCINNISSGMFKSIFKFVGTENANPVT